MTSLLLARLPSTCPTGVATTALLVSNPVAGAVPMMVTTMLDPGGRLDATPLTGVPPAPVVPTVNVPHTAPPTVAPQLTETLVNPGGSVSLNVDGATLPLVLTLRYNETAAVWALTVRDGAGGLVLDSVALTTGNRPGANVLRPYAYLKVGAAYVLQANATGNPNANQLGTDYLLLWTDTPASKGGVATL